MDPTTVAFLFFIFLLSMALGFELISKVPATLHTPLMSGSNAISGITIVGALIAAGAAGEQIASVILGTAAVALAIFGTDEFPAPFADGEGAGLGTYAWQVGVMFVGFWMFWRVLTHLVFRLGDFNDVARALEEDPVPR